MDNLTRELEKAAGAVKIDLSKIERDRLTEELAAFLEWLNPLLALDAGSEEPVLFGHKAVNVLREDRAVQETRTALEKASPSFFEGYYRVPPVIE